MIKEEYDIKFGQRIFESLSNDIKPVWAGLILSHFALYVKNIPAPILELYPIIDNKNRWKEAHEQFTKIRMFGLENEYYQVQSYLRLVELAAKVTYNASGQPAPFDSDSGHYIPSIALKITEYYNDSKLEEKVKSAILSFSQHNKPSNGT